MPVKKPKGTSSGKPHPHISDDEAKAALIYMKRCLVMLRLGDWDIILSDEVEDSAHHAACNAHDSGRYMVTLYLPEDWADKPRETKRATLLHESLHVAHAQQERVIRGLEDQTCMSKDVYDLVFQAYSDATEYMVDKLTAVLCDLDVWPKWPTPSEIERHNMNHTKTSGL